MKNNFTKKLLGLALSVFSITALAQCPTITSMSVAYGATGTATVTPTISGTTTLFQTKYYYSVSSNVTQTSSFYQPDGIFTFPANGTYSVCLTIVDSLAGCQPNQSCTNIIISGMPPLTCNADFTSYTDSNCVTHFVNTSTGNNLTYYWSINGVNYGSTNPSASLANGTYYIGLNTFSNGVFCDSTSQYISVSCVGSGTNTPCQASYTYYTDSNCVTNFINTSTGSNLSSSWYINGLAYYTTNVSVNLPNGAHQIILHNYSNMQFCDSLEQYINVSCSGTSPTNTCQASFYTYTDSSCYTHFVNTSTSVAGSSSSHWYINGTSYYTASVSLYLSNGNYNVTLSNFTNWIFCDSISQTVNVACNSGTNTPTGCQANSQFYIFSDSTNAGNYFAYNLSWTSGNTSYLWNFGDGTTSTQLYPFHQYTVPGQYIVCLTVTGTYTTVLGVVSTCSDTYCDSSSVHRMAAGFQMSQVTVIPNAVTLIKQVETNIGLKAFPNPITDELTIEATTSVDDKLNYVFTDAIGRTVLTGNLNNSKATISTGNLEKGFYSLSITNEKGSSLKTIKLVK